MVYKDAVVWGNKNQSLGTVATRAPCGNDLKALRGYYYDQDYKGRVAGGGTPARHILCLFCVNRGRRRLAPGASRDTDH